IIVVTNLLLLVAGGTAGFVICFAPYIITMLFGEEYRQSLKLVLIFTLGILGLTCGCAHLVIQAATNGKFARDLTIVSAIALFGAACVLIPCFGIEGAAAARSATQIGVAVVTFAQLGKVLGPSAGTRQSLRSFGLLVMLVGGLALLRSSSPELRV